MTISFKDIMKLEDKSIRLECENRWMIWDTLGEHWIVYERKKYQKYTRTVMASEKLEEALSILIKEVNNEIP